MRRALKFREFFHLNLKKPQILRWELKQLLWGFSRNPQKPSRNQSKKLWKYLKSLRFSEDSHSHSQILRFSEAEESTCWKFWEYLRLRVGLPKSFEIIRGWGYDFQKVLRFIEVRIAMKFRELFYLNLKNSRISRREWGQHYWEFLLA